MPSQAKLDEFIISHYPKKTPTQNYDYVTDTVFHMLPPKYYAFKYLNVDNDMI